MGRSGEPMPAKAAAAAIYSNLQSRGGIQPGRVYSMNYFGGLLPGSAAAFGSNWLWWDAVFAELNALMMAGGYGFPALAYEYAGQQAFFLGDPNDPSLATQFYGDPLMDQGMPIDAGAGSFMDAPGQPDQIGPPDMTDFAQQTGAQDQPDLGAALDWQNDLSGSSDPGAGDGGGFDGGGFDSGGFDGGGFDGGGGLDS